MAPVAMICPKCQRRIEPYQFTFSTNGEVVALQKCPTCEHEWRDVSRTDGRDRDERKATGT